MPVVRALLLAVLLLAGLAGAETTTAAAAPAGATPAAAAPAAGDEGVGSIAYLGTKIRQGGAVVYLQILLSIIGGAYVVERFIGLRRRHFVPAGLAEQAHGLWKAGRFDDLLALCRNDRSALGQVLATVVQHRASPASDVQAAAADAASRRIGAHLSRIYPLTIIATISPMLGLLGTIIGMIGAFETVSAQGELGNASVLADDIAKALVTTAGGLIVAIPMLGFYHFFKTRINALTAELEDHASGLIDLWLLQAPPAPVKEAV